MNMSVEVSDNGKLKVKTLVNLTERYVINLEKKALKAEVKAVTAPRDETDVDDDRKGQEREPQIPPKLKQEPEDILDIDQDYSSTERKKTCQRKDSEKRKKENFIVVQSDLWDTNTFQYTCQKSPPSHAHTPMQRSVSEKSRQQSSPHHHRETDSRSTDRRASNASINHVGTTARVATPEGYRDAETLRMTDRLSKRRGSEFPQPVSTPPHQIQTKRRQSAALMRTYQEEKQDKPEIVQQKVEEVPKRPVQEKIVPEQKEIKDRKPDPDIIRISKKQESPAKRIQDPDTIRVTKGQESPSKRLRQEAEPLKRAKGVGDSPRLSQASQSRPDHYKSSPNVASRHKTESPSKRDERKSATYSRTDSKRQDSVDRKMYTASSESELFECAILPIFHKLLTERHKSQPHGLNLSYGVSCPNISIKCDIVEYL